MGTRISYMAKGANKGVRGKNDKKNGQNQTKRHDTHTTNIKRKKKKKAKTNIEINKKGKEVKKDKAFERTRL